MQHTRSNARSLECGASQPAIEAVQHKSPIPKGHTYASPSYRQEVNLNSKPLHLNSKPHILNSKPTRKSPIPKGRLELVI